jgi:RNA polymerase sigma-70 factor (ECF subfamily)
MPDRPLSAGSPHDQPAASLTDADRLSALAAAESLACASVASGSPPFEAAPDECETPAFIARLLLRDEHAWTRFIERFQRLIHARVLAAGRELGRGPTGGWVEEACAEVLAALFRNDLAVLRRFEGRCRFSTWLSVVARRVALAHIVREDAVARRHRPPRSDFDLDTLEGPAAPGTHGLPGVESASVELDSERDCGTDELRAGLARLRDEDRTVLERHYLDGLGYEALAAELGIAVNSVGAKLTRARRRLREQVERGEPVESQEPARRDAERVSEGEGAP